jgi:N-acetylmuramoyl-L-alanine amidase
MGRNLLPLASWLVCGCVATTAMAADQTMNDSPRATQDAAAAGSGEDAAFMAHQRAEEMQLRGERAAYPGYFRAAYARYPRIPRGTLEAIAYAQSRWQHLRPDVAEATTAHMPHSWGVMGLYHGEGFADQVADGASLLKTSVQRVQRDPASNILAAAALLDRELLGERIDDIASIAPALSRYAGFAPAATRVQDYARASFAFDVLLALDRGVDDRGIRVPERPVQWERAFAPDLLVKLDAPFVRLDVQRDSIETDAYAIDPVSERLRRKVGPAAEPGATGADKSTDYGPALWVASPNYSSRGGVAIREAVVHTMQGSYAGSISWFQNPSSQVSAHYLIRSSDGQITQMVRESNKAWHASSHNAYSLGIEHEGFVNNASWYTTAMYNASSALTRTWCTRYAGIVCSTAYNGPASSGVVVLPDSIDIKGHQHLSGASHTDPGINWNWSRYYGLLNPGSSATTVLDSFESSVGHFVTSPSYSGSTTGIAATSSATRNCSIRHNGSCSLQVRLVDAAGAAPWAVRLLSGSGNPGSNTALSRSTGKVGFWVYAAGSGMQVAVGIDDSDGTERSSLRSLAANTWTYVEWALADAAQWNAWAGGANGAITAGTVQLDALWLLHADTSYTVNAYIDNVQYVH